MVWLLLQWWVVTVVVGCFCSGGLFLQWSMVARLKTKRCVTYPDECYSTNVMMCACNCPAYNGVLSLYEKQHNNICFINIIYRLRTPTAVACRMPK